MTVKIESIRTADPAGLHMALDRWIKNEYVYSESTNINDLVCDRVREEDPYHKDNPDKENKRSSR